MYIFYIRISFVCNIIYFVLTALQRLNFCYLLQTAAIYQDLSLCTKIYHFFLTKVSCVWDVGASCVRQALVDNCKEKFCKDEFFSSSVMQHLLGDNKLNVVKEITICGCTCTSAGCGSLLIDNKVLQLVVERVVVLAS